MAWESYLGSYEGLMGDRPVPLAARRTFRGVLEGIMAGKSLRAAVIARFSP